MGSPKCWLEIIMWLNAAMSDILANKISLLLRSYSNFYVAIDLPPFSALFFPTEWVFFSGSNKNQKTLV